MISSLVEQPYPTVQTVVIPSKDPITGVHRTAGQLLTPSLRMRSCGSAAMAI